MKTIIELVIFTALIAVSMYVIFGLYAMRVGHPIW